MQLGELASRLGCNLAGGEDIAIEGVAGIEEARAGEVTFLSNPKYASALSKTRASAVIVDENGAIERGENMVSLPALRSQNPSLDFARAIEFFHAALQYSPGIHPTAVIAKSAKIGAGAHIGP